MHGVRRAVVVGLGGIVALAAAGLFPAAPAAAAAETTATVTNGDIAFQSRRDFAVSQPGSQIYSMSSSGEAETNVTNDTTLVDEQPSWSPDGLRIAVQRRDPEDGSFEVWVMNADGSGAVNLTGDRDAGAPDWSPDGSKIVYHASDPDAVDSEIFVMDADGTDPVQLTENDAADFEPAWSPDGSQIAFRTNRDGNEEIYLMDADGSDQVNFSNHPAEDRDAAWSPDSTQIAFTSNRPIDGRNIGFAIHLAPRSGGPSSVLVTGITPEWSPDGRELAFSRFDVPPGQTSGNFDVFKLSLETLALTRLTESLAPDTFPSWQPIGAGQGSADVSVTLSDSADPVSGGSKFVYRALVRNAGPSPATDVALDITLPTTVSVSSIVPSQGSCSRSGVVVQCALGGVASGSTAEVRVAVATSAAGTLSASATVSGAESDPDPANNSEGETTTVNPGCTITGTSGPDTLLGTKAADVICGLGGNDEIRGGNGGDTIDGGPGDDTLVGNVGVDVIRGGTGADVLDGLDGTTGDQLDGGPDTDACSADAGDIVSSCP